MSVDPNALRLSDYALMSNPPLVQKITMSLLMNHNVLADIPLYVNPTLLVNGLRWQDSLPVTNWRKLNESPVVTRGAPTTYGEQAFILSNAIDVDVKIIQDKNTIGDPRGHQIEAYSAAFTYDMNDKFINNDPISGDADAFTGLRFRLDNPATYKLAAETKLDGGAVDISPTGLTATTANVFLERLQELLSYLGTEDGDGVVLYMNDLMLRRLPRVIRILGAGSGFRMDMDAFNRSVDYYRNAKIVNLGRRADQSARIITNTETAAGLPGTSVHTSIYAARYGEGQLEGWQFSPWTDSWTDFGVIPGQNFYRVAVDWAFGLLPQHSRCMGRLFGIRVN